MRPLGAIVASVIFLVLLVATYATMAPPGTVPTPQLTDALEAPSQWYFIILGAGMFLLLLYLLGNLRWKGNELRRKGIVRLSPSSIVPYTLSQRRYAVVFGLGASLYALLFSYLTSVVAVRPETSFAQFPGLVIPSVQPDQLVGVPLLVPEVTVFLSDHVALILIPITLMLMVTISILVGMNLALSVFAYDSRVRGRGGFLGGQIGAVVGLFTGCPTCAGLYFFSLLGGTGAASFAVTLDYYQPLFVFLCIPVLLASPYLISRSLSKVYQEGCVIVPENYQRS